MDQYPEIAKKLRVFISYARKDLAEVEGLCDGLREAGFEAYLDVHDILPGEPWQSRLGGLIETADTVVFVLSPNSVNSAVVDWEVNEAERMEKRVLPVVIRDVDADRVPGRIKRLNYVFMRTAEERPSGLKKLAEALLTDVAWIREHTRLGELAAHWRRQGRRSELLLRGSALLTAEAWIASSPPASAAPTDLHRAFIQASRAAALRQAVRTGRIQVLIGLLAVAAISAVGYLAWLGRAAIEFQARLLLDRYVPMALTTAVEEALLPGARFSECASCPEMVVVPKGEFLMGSPPGQGRRSERPQHKVVIARTLAVSRFEVTFSQWDACMAHGGCTYHPDDRGWGRGALPVTDVSWNDARQYLQWLSKQTGREYRLLSEAEWEYVARAGSTSTYPWGSELGENRANCPGAGTKWEDKQPAPVGSFAANGFGLYDMIGNLWEWVEDNWHPDYTGALTSAAVWPGGDGSKRVLRGGSYAVTGGMCYTAFREFERPPEFRNYIFGIRIARTLKQP